MADINLAAVTEKGIPLVSTDKLPIWPITVTSTSSLQYVTLSSLANYVDTAISDAKYVKVSTVGAKGDIYVASMDNTVTTLSVSGANGVPLVEASGSATGLAWGQVTAAGIASNAVTTAKILDSNVTEAKIGTGAVTKAKISAEPRSNLTTYYFRQGSVYNAASTFGATSGISTIGLEVVGQLRVVAAAGTVGSAGNAISIICAGIPTPSPVIIPVGTGIRGTALVQGGSTLFPCVVQSTQGVMTISGVSTNITTFTFVAPNGGAPGDTTNSFALASGDYVDLQFYYEKYV